WTRTRDFIRRAALLVVGAGAALGEAGASPDFVFAACPNAAAQVVSNKTGTTAKEQTGILIGYLAAPDEWRADSVDRSVGSDSVDALAANRGRQYEAATRLH